jgi:acyl-[acyl-carrier-protein]-phospholipid O-acyltransferase/long-chain-fatty-acid--[acyl-carrier-protein] ligase
VTAYLAVFAVAVGIGSAIAAWMSQGRIVLLPAPIGTVLMALFGLDLAWCIWGMQAPIQAETLGAFFAGANSIRVAIDLAGMAIAGAFLIVPTLAAVQAWAPEERRARIVAAVNIVNAGFMTVGGGIVAAIQAAGVTTSQVLFGLALLNAVAAWLMLKYLPTNAFRDFVSILFRAFHRVEVEGLENLKAAGTAPILALNHVSFLDGPLALTLTDEEPVFAIDYTIAQAWWMKPFLKLARAMPLNPAKPMSTRTLIKIVQGGDPLVIFPEGRIAVTGGLMKVYDGAAMVADKTGSMVVPIRIEGLEKSFFSRLTSQHVRRRLFPKVKVTILKPVKLEVAPELQGRKRRVVAGAALYQIMSDLVFRTQDIDKTILEKIIQTATERGMRELAVEDPVTGSLSYGKLLTGAAVLGEKFKTLYTNQQTLGVMLPNANGSCVTLLGVISAGKVPAMINFTAGATNILSACKAADVHTILTSRAFVEQAKLAPVIEELGRSVEIVWLDDLRATIGIKEKLLGLSVRAPRG